MRFAVIALATLDSLWHLLLRDDLEDPSSAHLILLPNLCDGIEVSDGFFLDGCFSRILLHFEEIEHGLNI